MSEQSIYQIVFRVHCTACGQMLDPVPSVSGTEYSHGNATDCSQPDLTLPPISPEILIEVMRRKPQHTAPPAKPKAKAAPTRKPASKKR